MTYILGIHHPLHTSKKTYILGIHLPYIGKTVVPVPAPQFFKKLKVGRLHPESDVRRVPGVVGFLGFRWVSGWREMCCLIFFESSVTWWLMVVSKLPAIVISFVYTYNQTLQVGFPKRFLHLISQLTNWLPSPFSPPSSGI